MGLNEKPPAKARLALVAEESWQNPSSEMISTVTFAAQPVGIEMVARAKKGRTRVEWAPECAFAVEIIHLPSSVPRSDESKEHEADFTG